MRLTRWTVAAAALSLSALALTGCSSSKGASSAQTVDSNLKGDPIVIGTICSCSGVQAAALGKSSYGISAWAAHVNATTGLNGHPVKLIVKDDTGDPAKALQAAKELVEQDKVVAIVGEASVADQAFQQYVESKQVPVVGGLAQEQTFLVSPDFFPSGSSSVITTLGMMKEAKAAGAGTIGTLYCAESPVCAQVDGLGKAFGQTIGIRWESGKISATQPNYTAQCLAMKDKGANALFLAHNSSVDVRVAADCTKAGYKPVEVTQLTTLGPDTLASAEYNGAIISGVNATYTDDSVPGVKAYLNAVEAYKPGLAKDKQFNITLLESWAGGKLFEAAAKAANLGPASTSADVLKGLYSLKGETLDGLSAPLTFAKGKPALPSCYFVSTIKDGTLVAKQSAPVCPSTEELTALGQLLKALAG